MECRCRGPRPGSEGTYAEAVVAALPGYWVYSDVGRAASGFFATTTPYEWMFGDAAYRQLAWPV